MFPLSAEKLSLREIADFWSREIHPPASKKELLAKLESAWWLGEITGDSAGARLRYLGKIFEWQKLPGPQPVVFTTPSDEGSETPHRLANGEVVVDIRPRISVPRKKNSWSEDSCRAAFTILATMPSYEYFPELSLGLLYIELTEEEFFGWIDKRGFDPPKFWKRTAAVDVAQASDILINSQVAPTFPTTGRGAKTRAILRAYRSLSSNGMIHEGTTSQRRNDLILDKLRSEGHKPLPHERTIGRAIKGLKEC
ncbi:hypothetical protein IVA95_34200 [Bradyrhizobium sp. 157]|uniref:hypothetical protein n=1 Tax=Bradyrhizobium sp. 157 TaxID=2782631 RepID=UPI001FF72A5E|nr:hypothetical protein [Bradyrhizobium sp. 157]MCK1642476.1 hypothetical protein [Bradyrhizobium sp. 157]